MGIGNIYANEILFAAKIRPTRKSKTITKKEASKISLFTKKILERAIEAGGTTLNDFYKPDGNKGYFKILYNSIFCLFIFTKTLLYKIKLFKTKVCY